MVYFSDNVVMSLTDCITKSIDVKIAVKFWNIFEKFWIEKKIIFYSPENNFLVPKIM